MKLRKRKAETLMEFLIAMSVAGMIFIMISLALQRSTSSVAKIYAQDTLRAAAKTYIAGLRDFKSGENDLKSVMDSFVKEHDLDKIASFQMLDTSENEITLKDENTPTIFTFDLKVESRDEIIKIPGVTHFFNKK